MSEQGGAGAAVEPREGARRSSRPPKGPRKRAGKQRVAAARLVRRRAVFWASVAFGVFAALGVALAVTLMTFSSKKGPGEGERFIVHVPEGAGTRDVARLLAAEGLVSSEQLMAFYLALSAEGDPLPGEHILRGGSTPAELLSSLSRSKGRKAIKVVVPEGFHRFAIAERLDKSGVCSRTSFLRVSADPLLLEALEVPSPPGRGPASAEGYLFPATYSFPENSPPREVLERLVAESHARWRRIAKEHADAIEKLEEQLGWSRAEIMTLASMVEKEAAVDDERGLIAGVFLNRLLFDDFRPKLLQSDPTSGYGCLAAPEEAPSCATYKGKITPALNRDRLNRYSTYTNEGLPPGPIANPGERSIRAVLDPTPSRFLFFVAAGGGRHKFSETLEEHNKAIK